MNARHPKHALQPRCKPSPNYILYARLKQAIDNRALTPEQYTAEVRKAARLAGV